MSGWKIFPTTKSSSNSISADNSLAEFEELENQLAGSQGSLKEIDYDAILAEIDQDLDDGIGRTKTIHREVSPQLYHSDEYDHDEDGQSQYSNELSQLRNIDKNTMT